MMDVKTSAKYFSTRLPVIIVYLWTKNEITIMRSTPDSIHKHLINPQTRLSRRERERAESQRRAHRLVSKTQTPPTSHHLTLTNILHHET